MHRKTSVPRRVYWKALIGLLVGSLLVGRAAAQEAPMAKVKGLVVPINGTKTVQTAAKQNLKTVTNSDPSVARVTANSEDPTQILITGVKPGLTRVTLIDVKNNQEVYEVTVQTSVEHLQNLLKRVAPTANLTLVPTSENSVVIGGTAGGAEQISTIVDTARSVGLNVINNMRLGDVMQVQLCVVVAQVSRDEFRRMAFNFLADGKHTFFGSTVGQAVASPALVGVGSATLTVNGVLAGIPGTPNGSNTNLLFGVLNNDSGFLAFLQALRDDNVVKLLAEPKVVTMSGRPASFLSGGEQAIPVPAGLGQVGVQFEEFGTRLNFLPIVLANGKIHLEVEPEVSNLNPAFGTSISGTVVPGRDTQRVHTTVELEDGQTFAIGGLIQRNIIGTSSKVPVLGDLPFLGAFFSSKSFDEKEEELVILVTPRLVDAMACNQLPKYLPGQETRSPDDFELFLEGILEAPRGQREVFQDRRYVPAYRSGPTGGTFPCGDNGGNGCGGHGRGCGAGACGAGCSTGSGSVESTAPTQAKAGAQTAVFRAEDLPKEVAGQTEAAPMGSAASASPMGAAAPVPPIGEANAAPPAPEALAPEGGSGKE
jgi:pilus assembly protein CpaC